MRGALRMSNPSSPLRGCLAYVLALLLLVCSHAHANAHAVLLECTPAENAQLRVSPDDVTLRFDEVVSPVVIRILDASGRSLTTDKDVSVVDKTVSIRLPKNLPAGSYVVSYRVISEDSHPVAGSFVFSVGVPTTDGTQIPSTVGIPDSAPWAAVSVLLRTLFYVTFFLATGGSLFLLFVDRRSPAVILDRRHILTACGVAAVLVVLSLGVEGAAAAGAPFVRFFDPAVWRIGLGTTIGDSAGVIMVGLALLALGLSRSWGRPGWSVTFAGTILAVAGFGLTGHVATTEPRWVTAPALVVHVLCDAFWVGALLPLYLRLAGDRSADVAPVVSRFSRLALYVVPILVVSGLTIAVVQVRSPAALLETAYGRIFLVKLTLFAALFALAALNKLSLTPALESGAAGSSKQLRVSILGEAALIAGLLVATSLLGQQTPPRSLMKPPTAHQHSAHSPPSIVSATSGRSRLSLDVQPLRAGDNELTMILTNEDGTPLAPLELAIHLSSPALGIEESDHKATSTGLGRFSTRVPFPVAGVWTIEIDALVTDFDRATFTATVTIR